MFIRPVSGRYSSGFGGRDIGAGAESHLGQDIANVTGTPISAAASGYVSYAGAMGGYGNVVILTHSINGQSYATVYAHMSAIKVSAGQAISQGQTVGLVGSTGRSTGPHLHFEVHIGSWNGARSNAVNPMNFF
nr:M23 family metallopeptidase [Planococcus glaciei]